MLVLIAINHSPFWVRKYTEEFVGYVSAAEGFVFVSAFLSGKLFSRREERAGFSDAVWSSLQRSIRIYQAHLILLAFLFLLAHAFLAHLDGIHHLMHPIVQNPAGAGVAGVLLLFQPALLDILPLYVVFSLLTPAAFRLARYCGTWAPVLCLSWALWFWSHFDLKENLFAAGKDIAFINPGAFDLFAWQAIWLTGLWLGQRHEEGAFVLRARWITWAAAACAGFFFVLHWWEPLREAVVTDANWWMFNKWQLGPLRVANFAALAWLVTGLVPWLERLEPRLRWFSLIGRHMLPVFCSQIAFSVLLNGVSPSLRDDPHEIFGWLTLQVSCAFALAIALERKAAKPAVPA
ncbi:MAG: OpgC domain-containing protein [Verrucomicrobia bacterium]|nr:OpgC domain-containing protein [Verrucomicrobiota bacterium]